MDVDQAVDALTQIRRALQAVVKLGGRLSVNLNCRRAEMDEQVARERQRHR